MIMLQLNLSCTVRGHDQGQSKGVSIGMKK